MCSDPTVHFGNAWYLAGVPRAQYRVLGSRWIAMLDVDYPTLDESEPTAYSSWSRRQRAWAPGADSDVGSGETRVLTGAAQGGILVCAVGDRRRRDTSGPTGSMVGFVYGGGGTLHKEARRERGCAAWHEPLRG